MSSFLLVIIVRFVLRRKGMVDAADVLTWVSSGLVLGAIIIRLIDKFLPKWFHNKPTREELERKEFGKTVVK